MKYVHFASKIKLYEVCNLLEDPDAWKCSVASDMLTSMSTSYVDIHERMHTMQHGVLNAHLLSISVYERRTASVTYKAVPKALDAIYPSWKNVSSGLPTDGERKMKVCVPHVAAQFASAVKPDLGPISCVPHQLDEELVVSCHGLTGEAWYESAVAAGRRKAQWRCGVRGALAPMFVAEDHAELAVKY